jgi:hypothetical protein
MKSSSQSLVQLLTPSSLSTFIDLHQRDSTANITVGDKAFRVDKTNWDVHTNDITINLSVNDPTSHRLQTRMHTATALRYRSSHKASTVLMRIEDIQRVASTWDLTDEFTPLVLLVFFLGKVTSGCCRIQPTRIIRNGGRYDCIAL